MSEWHHLHLPHLCLHLQIGDCRPQINQPCTHCVWKASHHPKDDDNELILMALTGRRSLVIDYSIYIASEHPLSLFHLFVFCIYIINGVALSALSVPNTRSPGFGLWISSHLMDFLPKVVDIHKHKVSFKDSLMLLL